MRRPRLTAVTIRVIRPRAKPSRNTAAAPARRTPHGVRRPPRRKVENGASDGMWPIAAERLFSKRPPSSLCAQPGGEQPAKVADAARVRHRAAELFEHQRTAEVDLLKRVDQAAADAGRTVDVLIQVDLALEETKYGAAVADVPLIVSAAAGCTAARLVGLMLLPPLAEDPEDARPWFARLRALRDELVDSGTPADRLRELSMGMSHDFEVAIAEGATMVRVGTAIFGERHYS